MATYGSCASTRPAAGRAQRACACPGPSRSGCSAATSRGGCQVTGDSRPLAGKCAAVTGGELREWVHIGGPNGPHFGLRGGLLVADCGRQAILRLATASGAETVYADRCDDRPFCGPNDLCFGPDAVLYRTVWVLVTATHRSGLCRRARSNCQAYRRRARVPQWHHDDIGWRDTRRGGDAYRHLASL